MVLMPTHCPKSNENFRRYTNIYRCGMLMVETPDTQEKWKMENSSSIGGNVHSCQEISADFLRIAEISADLRKFKNLRH